MTTAADQIRLWQQAERRAANTNDAFLWAVQHGMTREDLAANIRRRPSLWQRFENWLDVLPSRNPKQGGL